MNARRTYSFEKRTTRNLKEVAFVATLETQRARRDTIGSWSRKRWLVVAAISIVAVIAVALIVTYGGGGGSGVGGGY
jgi:anti-sigma-K factor RskA